MKQTEHLPCEPDAPAWNGVLGPVLVRSGRWVPELGWSPDAQLERVVGSRSEMPHSKVRPTEAAHGGTRIN